MQRQHFEEKNSRIQQRFLDLKKASPEKFRPRLNLSWSNWGFGREDLRESAKRLEKAGVPFIELHGNHYGPDLGYKVDETLAILGDHGLRVSGVCGMFSADNDLASNRAVCRQAAVDYLRREIPFTKEVGGHYLLVVPGAVGRPKAYDDVEFERSAETLAPCASWFVEYGVKAAIEPIRAAETSLVHTVADAKQYIHQVDHPGVAHINGDVYHMQSEESHIGEAIVDAGDMLANLHFADSNRSALGEGSMDVCTIIRALYLIGHNREGRFVSFEPLGPGGDPYPAMYGKPNKGKLDRLVSTSIQYFTECEEIVRSE
ncbi:MAG TPA: sugar phosphate isomerase/epimerase family protein [Acidobacteriaceae bacterium]|nr:sugar phosphate isomerase/epimerase family protein [Acidobacteriaceae bacterium]